MAQRTWTKDDTHALIDVYERNPILWNTKCEEYRNKEHKSRVFSEIASKFDCNEGEIQRKLHNLRNQVSQELKKIRRRNRDGGGGVVHTSTWPFFSALEFLIPGLNNRSTKSSAVDEEEDTCDHANNEAIQETDHRMDDLIQRTMKGEKGAKRGSKRKRASIDDNFKVLKREWEKYGKERDENDRFGEYVAMELKGLQSDSNRRRLKSEIRKAIVRIVDEDDECR